MYTGNLLALARCQAVKPWRLPEPPELLITPLRWDQWKLALDPHPKRVFLKFILEGIRSGFWVRFNYHKGRCARTRGNTVSVCKDKELISAYLDALGGLWAH